MNEMFLVQIRFLTEEVGKLKGEVDQADVHGVSLRRSTRCTWRR